MCVDGVGNRESVCIAFYGTKCQDRSLPITSCPLQRRRPLPVGTCGGACPGSVRVCDLDPEPRVRSWHRSCQPARRTVAPLSSFRRWHPRRHRSLSVLASKAGTILLSGPLLTMASFGTPRGHSLSVGRPEACLGATSAMDALPRTKLVSRCCTNDPSPYPLNRDFTVPSGRSSTAAASRCDRPFRMTLSITLW
jgi:hypothetical protein